MTLSTDTTTSLGTTTRQEQKSGQVQLVPGEEITISKAAEVTPQPRPSSSNQRFEIQCGICYDEPKCYGLLRGCNHLFCFECVKGWRGKGTLQSASNFLKVGR